MARLALRRRLTRVLGHSVGPFCDIRRFVILTSPRTGSTALERLLDSHPQMVCEGELLARPLRDAIGFLEGRAVIARSHGARAWGFKLISQHVEWWQRPTFVDELRQRGYLVIHLERGDLLGQAISTALMGLTGRAHFRPGEPTRDAVDVDPVALVTALHHARFYRDRARALAEGGEAVVVRYEDDLLDADSHQRTADTIVRRIGLDPAPMATTVARVTPDDPLDQAANRDELVGALRTVRFGHLLGDSSRPNDVHGG